MYLVRRMGLRVYRSNCGAPHAPGLTSYPQHITQLLVTVVFFTVIFVFFNLFERSYPRRSGTGCGVSVCVDVCV
eukprot:COSAG01_NODE_1077_length_11839_cov_52.054093_7_plen_74_part_00